MPGGIVRGALVAAFFVGVAHATHVAFDAPPVAPAPVAAAAQGAALQLPSPLTGARRLFLGPIIDDGRLPLLAGLWSRPLQAARASLAARFDAVRSRRRDSRFAFDESSGRCLDPRGLEGLNRITAAQLAAGKDGECGDFKGNGELFYKKLSGLNLRGADFTGAKWYMTSFTDSDLTGAKLDASYGGQFDLRGSKLKGASLLGAAAETWSFDEADLTGARFDRTTQLPFSREEGEKRGMRFVP